MKELVKVDWVYAQLEDEESRFIFEKRRQYNQEKDYRYIGEIIDKYVPELSEYKWKERELIRSLKAEEKRAIIFGAGYNGMYLLQLCEEEDVAVDFFCDTNSDKQHTKIKNKIPVISPDELSDLEQIETI